MNKNTSWIVLMTLLATIIDGLLAGGNVDRSIVAMPAWQHLGPVAWANFSRYADLGSGQLFYPLMAIGGTLVTVAAALIFLFTGRLQRNASLPLYTAALCMLFALPISFIATPFMLSLRHTSNQDTLSLLHAFSGFAFWGRLQGWLHVGAFCANLWALIMLSQAKNIDSRKNAST